MVLRVWDMVLELWDNEHLHGHDALCGVHIAQICNGLEVAVATPSFAPRLTVLGLAQWDGHR